MSQLENRRKGNAPSRLLSSSDLGDLRSPTHLGRAVCFAQSTDSNVNLIRGTTLPDTPHGTADSSCDRASAEVTQN